MKQRKILIIGMAIILIFSLPRGKIFSQDNSKLILGEWRNYDTESAILQYEKYVFMENGDVIYSMVYVDSRELNKETYTYTIKENILILGMKKIIGSGNEYYRYTILSITDTELTIKRVSRYTPTEEEKWVRTSRT